jgi:broad specificity phosphatase PhoE
MKLIIIRHGETKENKAGIIQGHLQNHLSKTGIEQAKKIALRLKDEKINFIYSSDLNRAIETTKEITRFHPKVPLEFVKDLRGRFLGEWQGKNKKELGLDKKNITSIFPKDGETSEELFDRASNFLYNILSKHHNHTVLFISHNRITKAIISVITGKSSKDITSIEDQHNASVNIFKINEDKDHKILCLNCKKHLD